ncbi:hypothetical protein niasHT_035936 [Heterodera trifolii]|uniref:Serpin domain-containing protein n=1 Tax=Heterodera trifolii TaxID=157864 RepID=A0ABD2IF81_9BILA
MTSPPPPNAPLILEAQANFALKLLREVSTEDRAPESEVHQYFGTLLNSLTSGQNSSNTLETANKVYVNKGFRVKSAFKGQIEENYGGQLETVDFKDSEGTAEVGNYNQQFVDEATHQKIRDLITPDALDKETRARTKRTSLPEYGASKEERFVADHPFCAFLIRDDTVLFSAIFRN